MNRLEYSIDRMLIEESLRIEGDICEKVLRAWRDDERMDEILFRSLVRCGWNHLVMLN